MTYISFIPQNCRKRSQTMWSKERTSELREYSVSVYWREQQFLSLDHKLKEDRMKRPGTTDRSPVAGAGGKSTSFDREKEELKNTIKKLEGRLSNINTAEKPLEEDQIEDHPDQDEMEKRIKTASELARWDESKKWQHKIEILRSKLTDADGEVSKLSKTNNSLR